jgi:hypothetical protein
MSREQKTGRMDKNPQIFVRGYNNVLDFAGQKSIVCARLKIMFLWRLGRVNVPSFAEIDEFTIFAICCSSTRMSVQGFKYCQF